MSNRKLQTFDEYSYGKRGLLKPCDRFRVSGGPYYENQDGTKTLMAERGTFTFSRYCVRGAEKHIEAYRADGGGIVVLWVGKPRRNPDLPTFRRMPYKIRKITDRKRPRKKKSCPA
jgi:hypothetical protein